MAQGWTVCTVAVTLTVKLNAGLTLGIIGTALGAWALFGNRRSAGVLGTGTGLMGDGSTNINVVGVTLEVFQRVEVIQVLLYS